MINALASMHGQYVGTSGTGADHKAGTVNDATSTLLTEAQKNALLRVGGGAIGLGEYASALNAVENEADFLAFVETLRANGAIDAGVAQVLSDAIRADGENPYSVDAAKPFGGPETAADGVTTHTSALANAIDTDHNGIAVNTDEAYVAAVLNKLIVQEINGQEATAEQVQAAVQAAVDSGLVYHDNAVINSIEEAYGFQATPPQPSQDNGQSR